MSIDGSGINVLELVLKLFVGFMLAGLVLTLIVALIQATFYGAAALTGVAIGGALGIVGVALLHLILIPGANAIRRGWAAVAILAAAVALHILLQREPALPGSLRMALPTALVAVGFITGLLAEFWARSWEAVFELVRITCPLAIGTFWISERVGPYPWHIWVAVILGAILLSHLVVMLFRRRARSLEWRRRQLERVPNVTANL